MKGKNFLDLEGVSHRVKAQPHILQGLAALRLLHPGLRDEVVVVLCFRFEDPREEGVSSSDLPAAPSV